MIGTLDRVLFLKAIDIFSEIPSESLVAVAEVAQEIEVSAGQEVLCEGDLGDCMYLVVQGELDVRVQGNKVASLRSKECVGEMSLLDSEPRCASVVATTDAVLLRVAHDEFFELLSGRAEIARGVIALLTRRLRQAVRTSATSRLVT